MTDSEPTPVVGESSGQGQRDARHSTEIDTLDTTRRRFLQSAGAAVVLGGTAVGSASATSEDKSKLVFIFDDGYEADYTQTFPIFQQEDVPACLAVPSGVVNEPKFLSEGQMTEMTNAGWEVLSHGVNHEALGSVKVTHDVAPQDERVYVNSTVLGRTPHEVEIYNGDKRAVAKLAGMGEDETGRYLTLKSSVGESFTANEASMRFTEEVVRWVLNHSKKSLRDRGFDVTNLVLPYGRYDQRTLRLIPEYYNAVANVQYGGINGGRAANPYRLSRAYFREGRMTEDQLATYLDKVANFNSLGLLGGHTRNQKLTGERIQTAIQMAKERDIEIVTLQTALRELDIVEAPTPTPTATPSETPSTTPTGTPRRNGDSLLGGFFNFIGGFFDWLSSLLNNIL